MRQPSKDRWKLQKQLSILRKCARAADREASVNRDLIDSISSGEPYYLVAENLHYASAWDIARGVLALMNGADVKGGAICCGWRRSALDTACLAERCLPSTPPGVRRTQFSWFDTVRVAKMLLFSYSFGITRYIRLFGDFLSMLRNSRVLENPAAWITAPVAHLAYTLYLDSVGRLTEYVPTEAEKKMENLHSDYYSALVNVSDNNASQLYDMLLNFRMVATDTHKDPYDDLLFGILPIEFLAVRQYYQSKGVCQDFPHHEVLATPLLTLKWQADIEDPLYSEVKAYCCDKRPSLIEVLM